MDNFEELKKKVEDYPNSSLFVPLAEEYKKRGELDEAINVLKKGLERQPNYTSARVSIAKIYLEKGMRAEAVEELEKVLEVSPENFFAHKKLAETYCRLGRRDDAISQYNEVLKLNPGDEDAAETLERLEGGGECEDDSAAIAAELEALSSPPEEKAPTGADSTTVMETPIDAAEEDDALEFDTAAFVEQAEPFADENMEDAQTEDDADVAWDVEDTDFDMGGLEFEPDGVFGDEDSGEVSERYTEAGLDIGVDVVSGSDEAVPEEEDVSTVFEAEAESEVEAEALDLTGTTADDMDILTASEKVGHEILNEPLVKEPSLGRESLVPSGGIEGDTSKEYSGESFIGNDDENVVVTQAPGLETFEVEEEASPEVPQEDRTVMMREPLAGMDEGFAAETELQDEQASVVETVAESTVIMEAPSFDSVAAVAQEDKTVIMQANDLEAMGTVAETADDGVVYGSEPFASLDDTRAFVAAEEPEALTAEPGTIGEESLLEGGVPINDPFAGLSGHAPEALEAEAFEAEAFEAEAFEAEAFEAEAIEAEAVGIEAVEAEAQSTTESVPDLKAEIERADALIASGEYSEARRIYSSLLSAHPKDTIVRMKMQELVMLLKVSGRGGELYTNGLESFLASIMRRRDELRKDT